MKYVPATLTRFAGRSLLKVSKHSPTILVVSGVVGFGATAFLAARATRKLDPILDQHKSDRAEIGYISKILPKEERREKQIQMLEMYYNTGLELTKLYGPAIITGSISALGILYGHNILRGRHAATMAAFSGLQQQMAAYRERVAKTLGESAEKDIYHGAHGEWVEDPDHKGEYKLTPVFDAENAGDHSYARPWFDETNVNWSRNPQNSYMVLKGVQNHMNQILNIRGHLFLNEVFDALHIPRSREGAVTGWVYNEDGSHKGDGYVDFGFMTGTDPATVAFRNGAENSFRFNFNVDGIIWDKI